MKSAFLLSLIFPLIFLGCETVQEPPATSIAYQFGKISLTINDAPPGITKVLALLSRYGYDDRILQLEIADSNNSASGLMNNVASGMWNMRVDAFDGSDIVRYRGEKSVMVIPDTTTVVDLILMPMTGNLQINVTWGSKGVRAPKDLVAWWTSEYNTRDIIGSYTGEVQNGVSYSTGVVGKGFCFNGIDGRINFPDVDYLKLTGSLTIEGWINISSYPVAHEGHILFRGDDRIGLDPYDLRIIPGGKIEMLIASQSEYIKLNAPIPSRQFVHVAATLDSLTGSLRLYLNGTIAAETTTTIRPFRDLSQSYAPGIGIGNTQGSGSEHNSPFHGTIDELSVYKRSLTINEIRSIYLAGKSGKYLRTAKPDNNKWEWTRDGRGGGSKNSLVYADGMLTILPVEFVHFINRTVDCSNGIYRFKFKGDNFVFTWRISLTDSTSGTALQIIKDRDQTFQLIRTRWSGSYYAWPNSVGYIRNEIPFEFDSTSWHNVEIYDVNNDLKIYFDGILVDCFTGQRAASEFLSGVGSGGLGTGNDQQSTVYYKDFEIKIP
jgi:hypothetical protein